MLPSFQCEDVRDVGVGYFSITTTNKKEVWYKKFIESVRINNLSLRETFSLLLKVHLPSHTKQYVILAKREFDA